MKTVTLPEQEYLQMQTTIQVLEQKVFLLQDKDFLAKINQLYTLMFLKERVQINMPNLVTRKRGSGKHLIKHIADDFDDSIASMFKDLS